MTALERTCAVCGERDEQELVDDHRICRSCLNRERIAVSIRRLEQERGELTALEAEIASHATTHLAIARDADEVFESTKTFGQRIADRVAVVGGSWVFVIGFFAILVGWVVINVVLATRSFDPYPFILLNLVLSTLAAVQAPIIMMSQNRVAARDRAQASEDFRTNLKAELEIASLHFKIDHLLHAQWDQLIEMQTTQLDLLQQLADRRHRG